MRLNNTFQALTLLIILLTLCISVPTLAQDVKTTAEQQAQDDVNKLFWFILGAITPIIPAMTGCYIGAILDPAQPVHKNNGTSFCLPNNCFIIGDIKSTTGLSVGMILGTLGGTGVSHLIASSHSPTPSPTALLGKSSEDIQSYTDAYKVKSKKSQKKWALIGAGCGTGYMVATLLRLAQPAQ